MNIKNIINRSYGFVKNRQRFIFREVERKDLDEAIKIISWFWRDGFIHKSMLVNENKAKVLAEYYVDHYLFNGMSVGVFDERKDKLAGLLLNKVVKFGNESLDVDSKEHSFRSIKLALEKDYFKGKSSEEGKIFQLGLGAVYPEYFKNKIATEGVAMMEDIAKFNGCSEIGGVMSSFYSYKILIKLGYVCANKIKCSEFYDGNLAPKLDDLNREHEYFYWMNKSL